VAVREGRVAHSTVPADTLTAGLRALWPYAPSTGRKRLIGAIGTQLYATDTATQTFTSFLKFNTTLGAGNVRGAQFGDSFYLCDGVNPVKKLFGLTNRTVTPTAITNTITWGGTRRPYGLCLGPTVGGHSTLFIVSNPLGSVYHIDATDGTVLATLTDASLTNPVQVLYHTATGTVIVLADHTGGTPSGFIFSYSGGTWTAGVTFGAGTNDGALAHLYDVTNACWNDDQTLMAITQGEQAMVGDHVKIYTFDGTPSSQFNLTCDNPCSVAWHGGYLWIGDSDLQQISKVTETGGVIDVWQDTTLIDYPFDIRYVPAADTLLISAAGLDQVVELDLFGNLVATYGGPGLAVGEFDAPHGLAVDSSSLTFYVNEGNTTSTNKRVQKFVIANMALDTTAVLELTDPPTPTPPAVTLYQNLVNNYDAGNYDIGVTYARLEERQLVEGDMISMRCTVPAAMTDATGFTVRIDITNEMAVGDFFYIYLKLPGTTDYLYMGRERIGTGDTTVTYTFTTPPVDGTPIHETYLNRPPVGCSLLMEWFGRMVYAKGDVLYVSNPADAERIPLLTDDLYPADYGTWMRIGSDGDAITGLGKLGTFLVVFKSRSVWLVSGDGWAEYQRMQIDAVHGCVRHESIISAENLIAWAGPDGLFYFDGQRVDEFTAVRGAYQSVAAADRAGAFSAYDPQTRRAYYFLPSSVRLATPLGQALVFDFTVGAWTLFTIQPSGCACWMGDAATPGLYAGDPYGATNTGKLYRLGVGTTDATSDGDTPICFTWLDRLREPFPGQYTDVERVGLQLARYVVQSPVVYNDYVGCGLYANTHYNYPSDLYQVAYSGHLTRPTTQYQAHEIRWSPAPLASVAAFQVQVIGQACTAFEISRIDVGCVSTGRVA